MQLFRHARLLVQISTPLALALLTPAMPLSAADQDALASADAHEDLYAAMRQSVNDAAMIEGILDTIVAEIRRAPEMARMEEVDPALMDNLRTNTRPILQDYSNRVRLAYYPKAIALLKENLSDAEASELAAFYRSDIALKLIGNASGNFTGEETLLSPGGGFNQQVDSKAVSRDIRSAGIKALLALTPDERKQLDTLAQEKPVFAKFDALQPRLNALRAEMDKEKLTADEQKRINAAMKDTFSQFAKGQPPE